jgi:hypothetical protein
LQRCARFCFSSSLSEQAGTDSSFTDEEAQVLRKRHPVRMAPELRSGMLEVFRFYFAAALVACPAPARSFRPRFEAIEDRHMFSVSPLVVATVGTNESVVRVSGETAAVAR